MSKKIILTILFVGLVTVGFLLYNSQTELKANPKADEMATTQLAVTVYNFNGTTPVGNARVNLVYGGSTLLSMLSDAAKRRQI